MLVTSLKCKPLGLQIFGGILSTGLLINYILMSIQIKVDG